ncbi:MAG TPA: MFS transporter, partial [Ktedonobacteraceae bacterium]|nr:MFS transporter [Ktedonobacteraceae bacterium]
ARLAAIYASVFLLSGISRFFTPARAGVLQVVVAPQQQAQAASIGQVTFAIAIIVGPAIASPLYFVVGPVVAILINAVSFLVSALFLLAIRVSRKDLRPYVQPEKGGASAVVSELYAGLRLIATTRVLLMVIILALIAMLGAGALNALDIIFVSQRLHVSVSLYGPLSAVAGLGTLVGAVLAGVLASRIKPRVMLAGCVLLLGMGIVVYSFQSWFLAALIINFFAMIPQGGIDVGVAPLLMNSTPHEMMGRVQSFLEMTMYGVSLLSVALAGYFGQFIPVYVIFAICGGLIALAGVFGWFAIPS